PCHWHFANIRLDEKLIIASTIRRFRVQTPVQIPKRQGNDSESNLLPLLWRNALLAFQSTDLILWGKDDTNFGPAIAERLARDIPGTVRIEWLTNSAHLPMLEEARAYAEAIERFSSASMNGSQLKEDSRKGD